MAKAIITDFFLINPSLNSHGLKKKNDKMIFAIASNIKENKWQKH